MNIHVNLNYQFLIINLKLFIQAFDTHLIYLSIANFPIITLFNSLDNFYSY